MKWVRGSTHEGEEEQPGVEPAEPVAAVDEVVAAAQHPGAVVAVRVDQPDVGVGGISGSSRPRSAKSGWSNSVPPDSGAPSALVRPMTGSCSPQRLPVPGLDGHVDPAGDQVRAAGQPVAPSGPRPAGTQTCSSSASGSSALRFIVPSLNPNRFRGVVWRSRWTTYGRSRAATSARRPAEGDPGQVADRVHRDLRIVGAGLDAQVAVGPGRVEVVGREVRQPLAAPRAAGRRARSGPCRLVAEQRGPEAEGDGQPGRRQPDRLAGVVRRRVVRRRSRADRAGASRPGSSAPRRRSSPAAARSARRATRW